MFLSSKHHDPSLSFVKELESCLLDIIEIKDYLKIASTFPIKSLLFLKNLKRIRGEKLESDKYSLVLIDNANLQALWEEQEVEITKGMALFVKNPKLCYHKIEEFIDDASRIEDIQQTKKSNGHMAPCELQPMKVIHNAKAYAATFYFKGIGNDDKNKSRIISYDIYYTKTDKNVTKWDARDACGNDG